MSIPIDPDTKEQLAHIEERGEKDDAEHLDANAVQLQIDTDIAKRAIRKVSPASPLFRPIADVIFR